MKNNNKVQLALNEQINAEFYSAYMYLAMAAYFRETNFNGFASWMKDQAKEEIEHGMKFIEYMHARGWKVELTNVAASKSNSWRSPLDVFEAALAHEKEVTRRINHLMDVAVSTKDYATQSLLKWFVDEQVEEEASFYEIISKIQLIGKNLGLLLAFDAKLGECGSK